MAYNLLQGREAGHRNVAHRRMVTSETPEIGAAKKLNGKRRTSSFQNHVLPGDCVMS